MNRRKPSSRTSDASMGSSSTFRPNATIYALRKAYRYAVDPATAPGKIKRFTPEEIAALNAERVKR